MKTILLALLLVVLPTYALAQQQPVPIFQSKSSVVKLLDNQTVSFAGSGGVWGSPLIDASAYAEATVFYAVDACPAGQGSGIPTILTLTANDSSAVFQTTNHPNTRFSFVAHSTGVYSVTGFGKYIAFNIISGGSFASCTHFSLYVVLAPITSSTGVFGSTVSGTKVNTNGSNTTFPVVMGGIDNEQAGKYIKELAVDSSGSLFVTGSVTSSAVGLGSGSNSKLLLKGNAVDVTAGVVHTAVEVVNGGGAPIYCTLGPAPDAGAPDAGAWMIDNGRPVPAGGSWALDTTLGMYCASPVDQSADAGSTRVTTGGK